MREEKWMVFTSTLESPFTQSLMVSLYYRKVADKHIGFSKFVDYSKLQQIGGITDNLEDRAAIQRLARKKLCKQGPAGPGGQ